MDGRIALSPGAVLLLRIGGGSISFTIVREIGRGGSCIVYDASYTDAPGNFKLVRIKECFPAGLLLTREENGTLTPKPSDAGAFSAAKQRLAAAYQKNHDLFSIGALTNSVANSSDICAANGTLYIVSVYLNGRTFADYRGGSVHDCVSLLLSAAKALSRIHEAGYLYLDLKPDNILTLEGSLDLVQLFDFDSLIAAEDLADAIRGNGSPGLRLSGTRGYAPPEQQTGRLRALGKHSDLFSLGAVLYYALFNRTPSAFDCDPSAEYDYESMVWPHENYPDSLFRALTLFFHRTLASYPADRYADDGEAISQLSAILALSDETKPWLRSSPVQGSPVFFGREEEIASLSKLLQKEKGGVVSLSGMGGIGKSTLARQVLSEEADAWDAVLWLYDRGSLAEAVADDAQVLVNTVSRQPDESAAAYLARKLRVLSELAGRQRVLLVFDNFSAAHLDQLEPLRGTGWTILLISRERLPEGLFPAMRLQELPEDALFRLFAYYARCDSESTADQAAFRSLLSRVHHHTLLTELIARQAAKSGLSIREAEQITEGFGQADLPAEKIDYIRDYSAYHADLLHILNRLMETDSFTAQEKDCLKLLSLFDAPGIGAGLFRELAALESLDFVNGLEASGWLKKERNNLTLHPLMQETVRAWPWTGSMRAAADRMMHNLYGCIRPEGTRHDGSRQFPADYGRFYQLCCLAEQMIRHTGEVTEASQLLLYRLLMDAPVDQDASTLSRMLQLLRDPRYLDDDSVLRLYENAAYLRARLYAPDEAVALLEQMKAYLRRHPSDYYLSAYHRAMAVILHNADELRNLQACLRHEDRAIAAARSSTHPEAKKQLAACLLDKATSLLSADRNRKEARRLIAEARPIVEQFTAPTDYERYQYACIAAMGAAMDGDIDAAEALLNAAHTIAFTSPDSDLSSAEHLIEQEAPIRIAMGQFALAAETVREAIGMCGKHEDEIRYRETAFDAWIFLGRICAMNGEYIKGEAAFAEAEKRIADSPYEYNLPLCPKEIREGAEAERAHLRQTGG